MAHLYLLIYMMFLFGCFSWLLVFDRQDRTQEKTVGLFFFSMLSALGVVAVASL